MSHVSWRCPGCNQQWRPRERGSPCVFVALRCHASRRATPALIFNALLLRHSSSRACLLARNIVRKQTGGRNTRPPICSMSRVPASRAGGGRGRVPRTNAALKWHLAPLIYSVVNNPITADISLAVKPIPDPPLPDVVRNLK